MKIRLTAAVTMIVAFALAAMAHHSTAIYNNEKPIELRGTVVEWKFTNPHCLIRLEVTDEKGAKTIWTLEGGNTSGLFRDGWTPKTFKPGDKIMATVRPLRSGAPGGNYNFLRWEDGAIVDPKTVK